MKKIISIMLLFFVCFFPISNSYAAVISGDWSGWDSSYKIFPEPPEGKDHVEYVVFGRFFNYNEGQSAGMSGYNLLMIYSDDTFDSHIAVDTNDIGRAYVVSDKNVEYKYYKLNSSSKSWDLQKTSEVTSNTSTAIASSVGIIYESSVDIVNYNNPNEIFFQAPPTAPTELYQIVQEVTTGEMTKTQSNLVGVMRILTLCGVGLLALLMVLLIFGKVLRIFQVK